MRLNSKTAFHIELSESFLRVLRCSVWLELTFVPRCVLHHQCDLHRWDVIAFPVVMALIRSVVEGEHTCAFSCRPVVIRSPQPSSGTAGRTFSLHDCPFPFASGNSSASEVMSAWNASVEKANLPRVWNSNRRVRVYSLHQRVTSWGKKNK